MQRISLSDLESKKVKRIYVLNQTKGFEKGNISISFPKSNGQGTDTATIPATFIPIELTAQVTKNQILDSNNFRASLSSGILQLVSESDAIKMLENPAAKREEKRLKKERDALMNNVMDLEKLHGEVVVESAGARAMMTEITDSGEQVATTQNGEKVKKVAKLSVQQLVLDLEETNDEDAAISTMMNIEGMTTTDYKFIYKNAKKYQELRNEAERLYKQLKEEKAKKRK